MLRRLAVPAAMVALAAVVAVGLLTSGPSRADRVEAIAARLRCPVCQGVSVADSPSDTARSMQDRIDELVAAGASDAEVYDHFVARYGEWVLLEPPLDARTWPLWLLPAGAVAVGAVVAARLVRRTPTPELTAEQRAAVADALARLGEEEAP